MGWWLLYNIGLISVINQCELATGVHMSPHSWSYLPLPTLSHSSRLLQSQGLSYLYNTSNLQVKIGVLHKLHMAIFKPDNPQGPTV